MQRLTSLRTGAFRLNRTANFPLTIANQKSLTLKRCLSSNKNENDLGINTEAYKPSTAKQETHVPDDLKGGQPKETFSTTPKSTATLTGGGKVWSVQNAGSVHIAPLGAASTTIVPTASAGDQLVHETTVRTSQAQAHIVDPLKTHATQDEPTAGQLAEAAAASAFETFPPDTPLTTSPPTDTVFAPKISSTALHSTASSPTAHFENANPTTSTSTKVSDTQYTSKRDSSSSDQTSATHEIPIQREKDIRDDILREALKYVNEKGWTMEAIRAGVHASNQPTTVEGLFSNGYDLVEYFYRDANEKLATYMNDKAKKGDLQGGRLLVDGLKYRLGLVIPYANTWDQALAQGALPQNAMRSWKNLLDLSSNAWHGIGDTSTDINWYSKRLLLAAVYKSSEIYMLQDQSLDKMDTMNFLERRLNDFQAMGSVRTTVSKSLSDTAQIASGLFSVVRNLTSRR